MTWKQLVYDSRSLCSGFSIETIRIVLHCINEEGKYFTQSFLGSYAYPIVTDVLIVAADGSHVALTLPYPSQLRDTNSTVSSVGPSIVLQHRFDLMGCRCYSDNIVLLPPHYSLSYSMDCFVTSLQTASSENNSNKLSVMNSSGPSAAEAAVVSARWFSICM